MAIRVVMAGAGGRMGGRIIHQIASAGDLTLSGALEREEFPGLGNDAGQAAGVGPLGVLLTSDALSVEGDVLISFAVPDAIDRGETGAFQRIFPLEVSSGHFPFPDLCN